MEELYEIAIRVHVLAILIVLLRFHPLLGETTTVRLVTMLLVVYPVASFQMICCGMGSSQYYQCKSLCLLIKLVCLLISSYLLLAGDYHVVSGFHSSHLLFCASQSSTEECDDSDPLQDDQLMEALNKIHQELGPPGCNPPRNRSCHYILHCGTASHQLPQATTR